jgi:NitT/TauT family transport system ATP-binding protein
MALSVAHPFNKQMTANAHIRAHNLRVRYDEHEVLRGLDFVVRKGEFVSILGKSGCGKSTLLHALAGFIEKDGEVHVPPDLGIVFQNYAVFPWLTVAGNIAYGLWHLNRSRRSQVVADMLERMELVDHAKKYPSQLSGGENQRVALARAMATNPEVVLMDEPFGALDPYTRDKMQTWLHEIWEEANKTVLFVTHHIEEAVFLSDRIIVLGDGEIRGEFDVPFGKSRMPEIKFTESFMELRRQVVTLLEQQ